MSGDPTQVQMEADPLTQRMTGVANHGLVPFDVPFMTEIAHNLWQGGTKYGLVLPGHIRHLVSLYPWEFYRVKHEMATTVHVRMLDGLGQDMGLIPKLAGWVQECRKTGPVAVVCQAGLNRSSLVVARVLMLNGLTAPEAIELIREKRSPACLCNPEFEAWLLAADGRALCPACGRRITLTATGRLRTHNTGRRGSTPECYGSRYRPRDATTAVA